ncbi:hypothetical protein LXJ15735_22680 [Lacrimispora xylanolytica]
MGLLDILLGNALVLVSLILGARIYTNEKPLHEQGSSVTK